MARRYLGGLLSTMTPGRPTSGMWTAQQHFIQIGQNDWGAIPFGTMTLAGVGGTSGPAYPGTQAQYAALATIPVTSNYSFANGYHYFDLTPGEYNARIKGAEGSGTNHGFGADISATISVLQKTRMVALIGNAGAGSYGGGGGTFLAITTDNTFTDATALLVAGGGGGGYGSVNDQIDGGNTSWTSTSRRGTGGIRNYDGGAAFSAVYNPEIYGTTGGGGQGSAAAQHFVWGGRGGIATTCGSGPSNQGGFGGGGGACPAGGGGFYGGYPGGDNSQSPGGGGTSYRLTTGSIAVVSAWTYNGTIGSTRGSNPGTAFGSLTISSV